MQNGEPLAESKTKGLTVYVSGEVKNPGMYEMPAGSRAKQAIEKATRELEEYRRKEMLQYESDFDRAIRELKSQSDDNNKTPE